MAVDEVRLRSTTSAFVWAEEFCAEYGLFTKDGGEIQDALGVMIGWFANAIETAKILG